MSLIAFFTAIPDINIYQPGESVATIFHTIFSLFIIYRLILKTLLGISNINVHIIQFITLSIL